MKIVKCTPQGIFSANCYIVISERNNAAIIDAPWGGESILREVEKCGATLKKILLTHGHCDHIESLAFIAEKTGAEVYIHENDQPKLYDNRLNLSDYFADYYEEPVPHFHGARGVKDGDVISLDEIEFRVLHTPGHTSGSTCFITEGVMFSGDTLFKLSIGRTDMPDGDTLTLQKSLQRLEGLKENYTVLSGHGEPTNLDFERQRNPYLKGFSYDDMF